MFFVCVAVCTVHTYVCMLVLARYGDIVRQCMHMHVLTHVLKRACKAALNLVLPLRVQAPVVPAAEPGGSGYFREGAQAGAGV